MPRLRLLALIALIALLGGLSVVLLDLATDFGGPDAGRDGRRGANGRFGADDDADARPGETEAGGDVDRSRDGTGADGRSGFGAAGRPPVEYTPDTPLTELPKGGVIDGIVLDATTEEPVAGLTVFATNDPARWVLSNATFEANRVQFAEAAQADLERLKAEREQAEKQRTARRQALRETELGLARDRRGRAAGHVEKLQPLMREIAAVEAQIASLKERIAGARQVLARLGAGGTKAPLPLGTLVEQWRRLSVGYIEPSAVNEHGGRFALSTDRVASGPDGRFRIAGITPGPPGTRYGVVALPGPESPYLATATPAVTVPPEGVVRVTLRVEPVCRFEGRVLGPDGRPYAGALVRLVPMPKDGTAPLFSTAGPAKNRGTAFAWDDGYVGPRPGAVAPLSTGGHGFLSESEEAARDAGTPGDPLGTKTGADGSYSLMVPDSSLAYAVAAWAEATIEAASAPRPAVAGEVVRVPDLLLPGLTGLDVTVVMPELVLGLPGLETSLVAKRALVRVVNKADAERMKLTPEWDGWWDATLDEKQRNQFRLDLRRAEPQDLVKPGDPAEDAGLRAVARFAPLAPGTYFVRVRAESYRTSAQYEVEIPAGEIAALEVTLEQGQSLWGKVVDERGERVGGAEVRWRLADGTGDSGATGGLGDAKFVESVKELDGTERILRSAFASRAVRTFSVGDVIQRYRERYGQSAEADRDAENLGRSLLNWRKLGRRTGRFVIAGLSDDPVVLVVTKDGYERVVTAPVEPGDYATPDCPLTIVLPRATLISGKVVLPGELTEAPAGLAVRLVHEDLMRQRQEENPFWRRRRNGGDPGSGGLNATRAVEANGTFKFTDLPNGTYVVEAFAPGFAPSFSAPLLIDATTRQHTGLLIELLAGSVVEGVVVDKQTGAPVEGAVVTLETSVGLLDRLRFDRTGGRQLDQNTQGDKNRRQYAATKTDAEGAFTIPAVPEGEHVLVVVHPQYRRYESKPIAATEGGDVLGLRLELSVGGIIRGIALKADGTPLPKERVVAVLGRLEEFNRATTGDDGRFEIKGLAAGRYVVNFERAYRRSGGTGRVVDLPEDGVVEVTLGGPATGTRLVLRVTQDGKPAAKTRVWVTGPGRGFGSQRTDATGTTAVEDLYPGTYTVWAGKLGGRAHYVTISGYEAEQAVELALATAVVTGTVRAPDGVPIAGASVLLNLADGAAGGLIGAVQKLSNYETKTNTLGEYRLKRVAPGRYRLLVREPGFAHHSAAVTVGEGGATFDVTLAPGAGTLAGTITGYVNKQASPIIAGQLWLERADGSDLYFGRDVHILKGPSFTIPGLAPGTYSVTVTPQGAAPVSRSGIVIEAGKTTEVTLKAVQGANLEITIAGDVAGGVLDPSALGAEAVKVELLDREGKPVRYRYGMLDFLANMMGGGTRVEPTKTVVVLSNLPTGPHVVRVSTAAFETVSVAVDLKPGQTHKVTIELTPK